MLARVAVRPSAEAHVGVGSTFGPYEIFARLTGGGMASVYLARRRGAAGFTRAVGIKVIHPHLAESSDFVDMFIDEAKLATKIQHPNVIHIEELGEREGVLYIAMEFLLGASLSQLLKARAMGDEPLDPAQMVWIAMQALSGLHAAHEIKDADGQPLGLVHRDISPQNILLAEDGNVKVIDFGIAKARGRHHQTDTGSGSLKGKLRYMAPEQARAEDIDRRSDVYAMGVVLWEMLTLRRLFDGKDELHVMQQIASPDFKPPSTHAPHVSHALDAVVLKALAQDPAERYQTALEFRRALAEAVPEVASVDATRIAKLLDASLGKLLVERRKMLAACLDGDAPMVPMSEAATRAAGGSGSGVRSREESPKRSMGWIAAVLVIAVLSFALTVVLMDEPEAPPAVATEPALRTESESESEPESESESEAEPEAEPEPEPEPETEPEPEVEPEVEPEPEIEARPSMGMGMGMGMRPRMHMGMERDDQVVDDVPIFDDGF